jgi:hypothetical protein
MNKCIIADSEAKFRRAKLVQSPNNDKVCGGFECNFLLLTRANSLAYVEGSYAKLS